MLGTVLGVQNASEHEANSAAPQSQPKDDNLRTSKIELSEQNGGQVVEIIESGAVAIADQHSEK